MSLVQKVPINFRLGQGRPALLFVKAEWCGHCQRTKPVIDRVSRILGSAVPVYTVDSDENKALVRRWQVEGFPTIMYSDGRGNHFVYKGARTEDGIASWVCKLSNLCTVR